MSVNLDEIKGRCRAATPGPWGWQGTILRQERHYGDALLELTIQFICPNVPILEANCEFVAHAREDVPALVAEVERLRAALREIRDNHAYPHIQKAICEEALDG